MAKGWEQICMGFVPSLRPGEDTVQNSPTLKSSKTLKLCKEVEDALRTAYSTSIREFGRVKVTAALIDIRWLSKLQCVKIFASPGTIAALRDYINAKVPEDSQWASRKWYSFSKIRYKACKISFRSCVQWVDWLASAKACTRTSWGTLLAKCNQGWSQWHWGFCLLEVETLRDDLIDYLSQCIPEWEVEFEMGSYWQCIEHSTSIDVK